MKVKESLLAGVLTALGASLCCVVPQALFMLGFNGAWINDLGAFERYRLLCVVLTLVFLSVAFHQLYLTRHVREPALSRAALRALTQHRIIFWVVTILLLGLLATPWFARPLL